MVWRTAERRVVGSVDIGGEGVVPPPFTPTGFLERHKKIKKEIDKKGKSYLCITPTEIAEKVGVSPEVVQEHIDVLVLDEAAVSVQKGDNPAICSSDGLSRLVDNLRKLRV